MKAIANATKFVDMADRCIGDGHDASANVYTQKATTLIAKSREPAPAPKPATPQQLKAAAVKKAAEDKAWVERKREELRALKEKVKKYEAKGNRSMTTFFKGRVDHLTELIRKRTAPKSVKESMKVVKIMKKGDMPSTEVLAKLKGLLGKMTSRSMRCAGNQGDSSGIRFLRKASSSILAAGGVQQLLMGSDWKATTRDEKFARRSSGFSKYDFSQWFPAGAEDADRIPAAAKKARELLNREGFKDCFVLAKRQRPEGRASQKYMAVYRSSF